MYFGFIRLHLVMRAQLAAPAVPTVATAVATCASNGTATVSNYSAALTYTSTPAGLSVGAGGVVTGFTCGTPYTITATNASTCFATSASFTVQCQLLTPAVSNSCYSSCYMCCKWNCNSFKLLSSVNLYFYTSRFISWSRRSCYRIHLWNALHDYSN